MVASYDASIWFRLPASFDGKVLSWTVEPKHPSMHFVRKRAPCRHARMGACSRSSEHKPGVRLASLPLASLRCCDDDPHQLLVHPEQAYFAPYPSQRHAELVAELQQVDGVQLSVLGQTLDGRDLDLLQIGVLFWSLS